MVTNTTTNPLLDSASTQQCEQLAVKADIQGKRAKALLALNTGDSNQVAAEKSGLTVGQVSYMLNRFNKIGMQLFNATTSIKKAAPKKAAIKKAVTKKAAIKKVAVTKPAAVIDTPETVDTDDANKEAAVEPVKVKDKKKKSKKQAKKDKKDKKSKTGKKDKKSSKKKKSKKNKK